MVSNERIFFKLRVCLGIPNLNKGEKTDLSNAAKCTNYGDEETKISMKNNIRNYENVSSYVQRKNKKVCFFI